MIVHLFWLLLGGALGAVTMALGIIAGDADRRPRIFKSRTVNRPREMGKAWVIAASNGVTQTAHQSWKDTSHVAWR